MSAPAHTVLSVQQFLTKNSMTPMPHPLYSPNLAQKQLFFCFPDEKSPQREMFCQCGRDETKMAEALKAMKINDCSKTLEQWKKRLDRCTVRNGQYLEGD